MSQESAINPIDKKIVLTEEFMKEIEFLKKESDIKRDIYAVDLLECLIKDQDWTSK